MSTVISARVASGLKAELKVGTTRSHRTLTRQDIEERASKLEEYANTLIDFRKNALLAEVAMLVRTRMAQLEAVRSLKASTDHMENASGRIDDMAANAGALRQMADALEKGAAKAQADLGHAAQSASKAGELVDSIADGAAASVGETPESSTETEVPSVPVGEQEKNGDEPTAAAAATENTGVSSGSGGNPQEKEKEKEPEESDEEEEEEEEEEETSSEEEEEEEKTPAEEQERGEKKTSAEEEEKESSADEEQESSEEESSEDDPMPMPEYSVSVAQLTGGKEESSADEEKGSSEDADQESSEEKDAESSEEEEEEENQKSSEDDPMPVVLVPRRDPYARPDLYYQTDDDDDDDDDDIDFLRAKLNRERAKVAYLEEQAMKRYGRPQMPPHVD